MAGSSQAPGNRPADELTTDGGKRLHPFVAVAGDLAALALRTRHPERFIWIDETAATLKIGSSPADPTVHRKHNLWISMPDWSGPTGPNCHGTVHLPA
ncbi:hypothetical protein ACIHEJ_33390 [Streptomyces sp. NPDC052301]|uniref:hypothetical protein n=1 Tax=Streptomyces sp. NPDC052301 TaxID=3365687 RepID=UPI0037D88F45